MHLGDSGSDTVLGDKEQLRMRAGGGCRASDGVGRLAGWQAPRLQAA